MPLKKKNGKTVTPNTGNKNIKPSADNTFVKKNEPGVTKNIKFREMGMYADDNTKFTKKDTSDYVKGYKAGLVRKRTEEQMSKSEVYPGTKAYSVGLNSRYNEGFSEGFRENLRKRSLFKKKK